MVEIQSFDAEAWKRKFDMLVETDLRANASWRVLANKVEPDMLRGLLAFACDFPNSPGYQMLSYFYDYAKRETKAASDLAKRLNEDADRIRKVLGSEAEKELLARLAETTSKLQSSIAETQKVFSKRTLNPTFFLCWLITEVNEHCGQPNYKHVANLLDVAYAAHGQDAPLVGEDAMRKTYFRFKNENPLGDLLRPEVRKNVVLVVIIVAVLAFISKAVQKN